MYCKKRKKGVSTRMAELPYGVRHGCHVQTAMAAKGIYLLLAIHDCHTGIFHMLCNIQNWRMPCKKEGRTNLQFPIFRISYPVCDKHSLEYIVRPRRDSKLMWRCRPHIPVKSTVDISRRSTSMSWCTQFERKICQLSSSYVEKSS